MIKEIGPVLEELEKKIVTQDKGGFLATIPTALMRDLPELKAFRG